ncbi:type III secretion protein [Proteus myxofaciens]|uniref:Uncharacterized protein n=1 Tax=Proteus myxofaciens ATCC 19692 TaxID=1354337 RepID=A0A198G596_9GAMM|nr:type III secretion protein [Proteus myxofaciens]OAT32283.1 hypothetical protein M983_1325 [Proteus myxofaciens ATCC 19692]
MRLLANQYALIKTIAKRQQRIERQEQHYNLLLIEANNKKNELQQLALALTNEIPNYEKAGVYHFYSLQTRRRKQAVIISSLNICQAQIKEVDNKLKELNTQKTELIQLKLEAIKKQKKIQRYFERKNFEKQLYLDRLEQNEIQEMALYEQSNT